VRFTLLEMFLATAVVATSLGTFGPLGVIVAVIVLAVFACIRTAKWKREAVRNVAVLLLVCLCLIGIMLLAASSGVREAARRSQCANRLKQIGVVLLHYHAQYGSFPPAYIADADGKPRHSWRVLLLPYVGVGDLYEHYNFDEPWDALYNFNEPWDGPNNSNLFGHMLNCYTCARSRTAATPPATSYLAVLGPKAAWSGAKSIRLDDVRDGPDNTIILVEAVNSGINWMEPKDLTLEEALAGINPKSGLGISSPHKAYGGFFYHDERGAHVLLADGTVHFLSERTSPETLRALLTIDGGEDVDISDIKYIGPPRRLHWPRCLSLVAWVISVVLLLARACVKV